MQLTMYYRTSAKRTVLLEIYRWVHYILIKPLLSFLRPPDTSSTFFLLHASLRRVLTSRRRRNVAPLWYHTYRKVASWRLWYRVIALYQHQRFLKLRKIIVKIRETVFCLEILSVTVIQWSGRDFIDILNMCFCFLIKEAFVLELI